MGTLCCKKFWLVVSYWLNAKRKWNGTERLMALSLLKTKSLIGSCLLSHWQLVEEEESSMRLRSDRHQLLNTSLDFWATDLSLMTIPKLILIKIKNCQRHNGPEGWVHITSSYTNLDQTISKCWLSINFQISTKHQYLD